MLEASQDEFGDFFDDGEVGGAKEVTNLFQFVNRGYFVFVGSNAVYRPGPPVRFHRPPARIHSKSLSLTLKTLLV